MNKNFDRSIEHKMNQHSVAPPFGAWNRIAAELDTITPAAAPAAPLIPNSALIGFLSGAALIATLVGGVLIYIEYNNETKSNAIQMPPISSNTKEITLTPQTVVTTPEKVEQVIVSKSTTTTKQEASEPILPTQKYITPELAVIPTLNDENNVEKAEPVFYFPAVDINTGNQYDESIVKYSMPSNYNAMNVQHSETDKKTKSSNVKEIRFKPRKDKKRPHNYGRTNRLK